MTISVMFAIAELAGIYHVVLILLYVVTSAATAKAATGTVIGGKSSKSSRGQFPLDVLVAMPFQLGSLQENPFQLTRYVVEPVLDLALQEIYYKSRLLPEGSLKMNYADSNASDTFGPWRAVEALTKNELDVVLGYANSYAMVPVARMSWLFKNTSGVPVITSVGQVDQLDNRKEYKLLTRMTGSYLELARSVISYLAKMNYDLYAYILHNHILDKQYGRTECYHQLSAMRRIEIDMRKINKRPLNVDFDPNMETDYGQLVQEVSKMANIFVICGPPDNVRDILVAAHRLGMTKTGRYLFINIDVSVHDINSSRPWFRENDTVENNEEAKEAFRMMKTISFRTPDHLRYKDFENSFQNIYKKKNSKEKPYKLNNFVSALYDGLLLYATAVNETMTARLDIRNGSEITKRMWNRTIEAITGNITINDNGDRYAEYSMLDFNPVTELFEEKAYFTVADDIWHQDVLPMYWIGGSPPAETPVCAFDMSKCPVKGLQPWAWSVITLSGVTFIFLVLSFFIYRHYKLEAALAAMSWCIRWDELNGGDRRRKDNNKNSDKYNKYEETVFGYHQKPQVNGLVRSESRTSWAKASLASEETIQLNESQQIFTKTACYKGTVVAIKKLNIDKPKIEVNRSMLLELKKMKDLQHDHITRFVGACIDPPHYCIVTEYCPKGSLQDILENDEIQLDKMMIYSLMHDLVKGMDFIHSSDIKSHGNLKSSNCVVDSRFVLKVTDFGLHKLRSLEDKAFDSDRNTFSYWRSKLWTAPELLRMPKPPLEGTQKGDVYSFALILHEMAFRQGVFYLENEFAPPQDIIERVILRTQPPFRPSIDEVFNADEALVALMTKCWVENWHERPDFSTIRKQVRILNKKFETSNIVDNLLKRMEQYATNLEGLVEERTAAYLEEKRKAENLLYQLLPQSVAAQLIKGEPVTAESFDNVTIYFSDIVGFTSLCSSSTPMQVVDLLNDLYTCFDSIIEHFDVYKVETIGDAYMVVSGLPKRNGKKHAYEIAGMALKLLKSVCSFRIRHRPDDQLKLRIGLHSGSVCAGVVGLKMPRFCLFGDTVNTASRMESNGLPLKIHVSNVTKEILDTFNCFQLELRGDVEMKGKGLQTTYWLLGQTHVTASANNSAPLPAPDVI